MINKQDPMYLGWLSHENLCDCPYQKHFKTLVIQYHNHTPIENEQKIINTGISELQKALHQISSKETLGVFYNIDEIIEKEFLLLDLLPTTNTNLSPEETQGYTLVSKNTDAYSYLSISSYSATGLLYGIFELLRRLDCKANISEIPLVKNPRYAIRMMNQWDNMDGIVERGFSGSSILFESKRNRSFTKEIMESIGIPATGETLRAAFHDDYQIAEDTQRIHDYARMLCSVGINSIVINNTNVHSLETQLIQGRVDVVEEICSIFATWGIHTFLSINFAAPITLKELNTSDPLDPDVINWWKEKIASLYNQVPSLGGFMVKADSEGRPGPFTYGRNHADGANMLATALEPFGGILIWRCFVYNCQQDWRDRKTDRAKSAYDCFNPLDGHFLPNVYLQIKNGPMDFQVREPITPLFGTLDNTNKLMELQITQEYTGQQKHVCYLVPSWKEVLDTPVSHKETVTNRIQGVAAVSNVGADTNWTGHVLAQANLYGYGRLIWNPSLSSEKIAREWIAQTFGTNPKVMDIVTEILMDSWPTYEKYTSPLGVGWMVSPGHHYGPDGDGYEYTRWGTYHHGDHFGVGVDRTTDTGTGFAGQYNEPLASRYNNLSTCPDELLLFFHHVPYTHRLHSGKTVIQHIYDSHFEGYEKTSNYIEKWTSLKTYLPETTYLHTLERLHIQQDSAKEWCDQINSFFYRMSGIKDEKGREIY